MCSGTKLINVLVIINAVKAITRSKGRNILIMLIVAVIAAASTIALSIQRAAERAETEGRANLQITATIGLDRQSLFESASGDSSDDTESSDAAESDPGANMDSIRQAMEQYPDLSLDQLQGYADSAYVKDFLYSSTLSLDTAEGLEAVSDDTDSSSSDDSSEDSTDDSSADSGSTDAGATAGEGDRQGPTFGSSGPMMFGGRSMGDVSLIGYGSEAAMTDFVAGDAALTDGSMIDLTAADNACLVSSEFASFNSLAVGDAITLTNPAATEETYTLTIAGIYENDSASSTTTSGPGGQIFSTSQDAANQIIASYPSVAAISDNSTAVATETTDSNGDTVSTALSASTSASYVLASPDDYSAFQAELTANGLDSHYQLSSSDLDNYEASLVPLQNLSSFAQTLLWIILGVGAVILVTIAIFAIRERKYEVGVLTAIGVSKPKVALQFVAEMLIVTVAGLIVGLGIGAIASPPIANQLLSAQVSAQESQTASVEQNFGRGGGPVSVAGGASGNGPTFANFGDQAVDYISSINASIDWAVVGQLAAIGIGLAILASLAGVIFVLRYEPLTILSNRS
ncbi:MAG: ABC transporter permease [Propionibacteriaceae bacterium]|nr:ABC transporter permease [Propionibacteriaceae bacterium]